MKITKQHCNDVRKSGKRGVNSIPIVANVVSYSAYSVVFRSFCFRYRLSLQAGFDLVNIFVLGRCSVSRLVKYFLGDQDGTKHQAVYKRVLTLRKLGFVDYDGKYASVSVKGLQALQSIEIDPELTSCWLDLQSRIDQSYVHHDRRLKGVREKK